MRFLPLVIAALFVAISCNQLFADDAPVKPRVAVFPLGGNADAKLKEHVQFAFRAKLDRQGTYEPIAGPTMADLVGDKAVSFATPPATLRELADEEKPVILIWGDLEASDGGHRLKLNVLDTREPSASPRVVTKTVKEETEFRFAIEQVLQTLKGVGAFDHPVEQSVWDDPQSRRLWASNPNLIPDGRFLQSTQWTTLYLDQEYAPPLASKLPEVDKVCIVKQTPAAGEPPHNVLAMNLSRECAENNGMACLSDFIKIEPNTRYRLQFKYKSEGPSLHVFVKGYTLARSAVGKGQEKRECYKRQVPPSGATGGKWITVVDDMNPQNPTFPVQYLRVDLYAYLSPGAVEFDDIQLRAVGAQTEQIKDDSIKKTARE